MPQPMFTSIPTGRQSIILVLIILVQLLATLFLSWVSKYYLAFLTMVMIFWGHWRFLFERWGLGFYRVKLLA